jgi:hypothetical protein
MGTQTVLSETVEHAASLDPVNMTVYTNPVVDLICPLGPHARDAPYLHPIRKIARIHPDGSVEFNPDSYIKCYVEDQLCVFGPLNADAHGGAYVAGGKYPVRFTFGEHAATLVRSIPSSSIAHLPTTLPRVGGGGTNVLAGFYDIFDKLKVQLIATVETSTPGYLDRWIRPVTDVVGDYNPIALYAHPGVNLCLEGLGPSSDRTILTAMMPPERTPADSELPRARGRTIMVNTVYSPIVALDGFANASYRDAFAVLALTKSLCSKKAVPPAVLERIKQRHPILCDGVSDGLSVHSFVKHVVLPKANCVCVMNEDELAHFTDHDLFTANGRGRSKVPFLGPLISAIKAFRSFQGPVLHRVYVTAGPYGSFVLTERNRLVYCGTYSDPHRASLGKTAIGDTYATAVLAIETIGNYLNRYVIPAEDVIRAAAAAGDASFYYGFGYFGVPEVNLYIGQPNRAVFDLGPIDELPLPQWMELRLDEVKERDYALHGRQISNPATTLQEVIGRAFLKT